MMDADPETARRAGIGKTRENIGQLEDALHLSAQDLKYASSTIQADLDRFQRQKVADLRRMGIEMARSHREWCKKVCSRLPIVLLPVGMLIQRAIEPRSLGRRSSRDRAYSGSPEPCATAA